MTYECLRWGDRHRAPYVWAMHQPMALPSISSFSETQQSFAPRAHACIQLAITPGLSRPNMGVLSVLGPVMPIQAQATKGPIILPLILVWLYEPPRRLIFAPKNSDAESLWLGEAIQIYSLIQAAESHTIFPGLRFAKQVPLILPPDVYYPPTLRTRWSMTSRRATENPRTDPLGRKRGPLPKLSRL